MAECPTICIERSEENVVIDATVTIGQSLSPRLYNS